MSSDKSKLGSKSDRTIINEDEISVGKSVKRIDSLEKVTGKAIYGTDLKNEGMVFGAVVRSDVPHGQIISVDTETAMSIDGVIAVVSRQELLGKFDNRIRFCGDVIAAVAAKDISTAKRAAREVAYEIEPLNPVFEASEAVRETAPRLHKNNVDIGQHIDGHHFEVENEAWVQNIDDYHKFSLGNFEKAYQEAEYTLEETYTSPRVTHCNLDTHCTVARWEEEKLVLTEMLASPEAGKKELAHFMQMEPKNVEIRMPPTGSSNFGGRSLRKLTLEPIAATLAKLTEAPVKLWWGRDEEFIAAETRHKTEYEIQMGISADGKIEAVKTEVMTDTGAYPNGIGHIVLWMAMNRLLDLYKIPNYEYEGVSTFTNNVPAGEYRGIGSTQFWFAMDSHMDELARKAEIDPLTFRQQNLVKDKYKNEATGTINDGTGAQECLKRGQERLDEVYNIDTTDTSYLYGVGLSLAVHPTAGNIGETEGATDVSEVELTVFENGRVHAKTGAVEQGQGSDTVIAQIISEETGIPTHLIDVERFPTSDSLTDEYGSIASRTTYVVGGAAFEAGQNLAKKLKEYAAKTVDTDVKNVRIDDDIIRWPGGSMPTEQLLRSIEEPINIVGRHETGKQPPSYGAHFAVVKIDPETGKIDIQTYVAAQDVGYAINPTGVEGQLEGAVLHGTEFVLFSGLDLHNGSLQNANFTEYATVPAPKMPAQLETEIVESNETAGPYGAKGVGTPCLPPVAPAILNAIRDATGHRFTEPPVTSEALHEVLQP